jgi:phospholipase/lecithinase/hemolysin
MKEKLLGFLLLTLISIQASAYTSLTVFGDSMFDGGNTDTAVISYYKLFGGGLTDSPYSNYRFTNGPTAAEYLATNLNLNDTSRFYNYAVGGATTTDIFSGVSSLLSNNLLSIDSLGLYLIDGGANDLAGFINSPAIAAQNITSTIQLLNANGANNFLVLGLPILGRSPQYIGANQATVNTLEVSSAEFNSLLATGISNLNLPANSITLFDTATVLADANASAQANGITNLTDACLTGGIVCTNPDEYVFWDGLHLSTKVHEYLGEALTQSVTPAVPEPETYVLLLIGLGITSFAAKRRQPS